MADYDKSAQLFEKARHLIPGGVNSPVRSFRSVGGTPRYIERAEGCYLYDVDGRRYIDYIGAWGAGIAGHAHPRVVERLQAAVRDGTAFGTCCPQEIELASEIVERFPSIDRLRMVNSGTEAVMSAIRLARAATGRERIVKFAGCYHGHMNGLLARAGSGAATFGLPDSPGVVAADAAMTLTATYGDLESVRRLIDTHRDTIAAVIVEPIAGNMGVVPPPDGFLEGLRELTGNNGSLLIFDEVMTGCRLGPSGAQGALEIKPDLTTLGKVIGGGIPIGAYGGRAGLMDMSAPSGPVYQAGTFSGNPLAMTGGLATLQLLDDAAYVRLEQLGQRLQSGLMHACREVGVDACVQRAGSMLTLFFGVNGVTNYTDVRSADMTMFGRFFHGMLRRGVHLPPSGYESWFVSLAHDETVINATIDAARDTLIDLD